MWDILIIVLIIWSGIFTPFQFAYLPNKPTSFFIKFFERLFDFIFLFDIFINFRTVYYNTTTGEAVINPKTLAINYLCSPRIFIDILASMPIELIFIFLDQTANGIGFLRLLKLAKLFRFGKLLAYLTMK